MATTPSAARSEVSPREAEQRKVKQQRLSSHQQGRPRACLALTPHLDDPSPCGAERGGREGGPPFGSGVKLLMCVVYCVVAGQFWPGVRFRSGAQFGERRRGPGRDTCHSAAPQRKCCTNGPGCVLAPRHNKQKPGQEDAAAAHRRRHPWVAGWRGEGPPPGQPPPTPSVKPFSGERVWVLMLLGRARGGAGGAGHGMGGCEGGG